MDLAYPTKAGYRHGADPLKWALRTAERNLPVDRVFIVGDLPRWLDRDLVEHVPTLQDASKFVNLGRNVEAIATSSIAEDFLWLNDDMFIVSELTTIPLYHRHHRFREVVRRLNADTGSADHRDYVVGMRLQLELLERWGFDDPWCTDLHVPIPLNKSRLSEILERRNADMPELDRGHFRALYGAGLPSIGIHDVKVRGARTPAPAGPFISTDPVSWKQGPVGRRLRQLHWKPSRWEI